MRQTLQKLGGVTGVVTLRLRAMVDRIPHRFHAFHRTTATRRTPHPGASMCTERPYHAPL